MDVSVVMCTWNNCERLRITLDAFRSVDVPETCSWELIVVNNNSTDATEAVVDEFVPVLPIKLVSEPVQGLSRARNAGVSEASGRWVVFVDDDVTPSRQWLSSYWRSFGERPTGYFFGGPVV